MKYIRILIMGSLLALAGGLQAEPSEKKLIINNIRNNSLFISAAPTIEQAMAQPFTEIKKLETYNKPIGFDGEVHLLFKQKNKPEEGEEIDHYTFEADKNIKFAFRKSLEKLQTNFKNRPKRLQRLLKYGYINDPEGAYSLVLRGRKEDDARFDDISKEIVVYSPETIDVIESKPSYTTVPTKQKLDVDAPYLPKDSEKDELSELPKLETSTTDVPPIPTDINDQPPIPKTTTSEQQKEPITDTPEPFVSDVPKPPTDDAPPAPTSIPPAPDFGPPEPTIDDDDPTKPVLPFDPSQLLKGKEELKKVDKDTEEPPKKEGGLTEVLQKKFEGLDTDNFKDLDTDNEEDTPEFDDVNTDDSEWEDDEDFQDELTPEFYNEDTKESKDLDTDKDEAPEPLPRDQEEGTVPPAPTDSEPPMPPSDTNVTQKPKLPFNADDLLKQKNKIKESEENVAPEPLPRDDEQGEDEESFADKLKRQMEKRRQSLSDDDEEDDDDWEDDENYDWDS